MQWDSRAVRYLRLLASCKSYTQANNYNLINSRLDNGPAHIWQPSLFTSTRKRCFSATQPFLVKIDIYRPKTWMKWQNLNCTYLWSQCFEYTVKPSRLNSLVTNVFWNYSSLNCLWENVLEVTYVFLFQFVFCRLCLQGFHIGECQTREQIVAAENSGYSVDPNRAATVSNKQGNSGTFSYQNRMI